jgi:hypothetical protein
MRQLLLSAAALLLAASCGSGTVSPASTGPAVATASSTTSPTSTASGPGCALRMGVAGLIPANWPAPSAEDWTAMYESLHETGSLLGIYTNWNDSAEKAGQVPGSIATAFGLAPTYDFTPFAALGFARDVAGGVEPTVDWTDSAQKEQAQQAAVEVARRFGPAYLGLGVEVNRLFESDPAAFDAFVAGYAAMYDAIKAASPTTLVFPIFQLEMMKGGAYLMGGSEARQPQWALLDRFAGRMDLAAFTTYPFLDAASPADLPDGYYSQIATHTSAPIAFTEIGWPSAPLSTAPTSEYGGSPDEQAAFVRRFFELTQGLDVRAELWAFPNDLNPDFPNAAMTSVSLRDNHGTAKPALAAWQDEVQRLCASAT